MSESTPTSDPAVEADPADVAEQARESVEPDVDPEAPVEPTEPALDRASEGDLADSLAEVTLDDDDRDAS